MDIQIPALSGDDYEVIPTNKEEQKELEEFQLYCSTQPVHNLQKYLVETTCLWRSLILAEQIYLDLLDYASIT